MLDDELKHEGLIIDEKEAKRQFLEELRNKNMQQDKKSEEEISKEQIASSKDTENNKAVEEEKAATEEVVSKESVNNEETIEQEESKYEELNDEVVSESSDLASEDGDKSQEEKKTFLSSALKISLIDTGVTAVTSFIGVYLFDLILRLFGYYVADFKGVYIAIFLIILVLYPVIMQKSKYGKTLGQKFTKI